MKKVVLMLIFTLTFSAFTTMNASVEIIDKTAWNDPYDCFNSADAAADAWGTVFGNTDHEYLYNVFIWLYDACLA